MKQRKLNRRKGFTLVELLVVIAILAILATVSVVGYTSFTKKAKVSNDVSLTTQMNTILQANEVTDGTNATPHEAVEELVDGGLDVTKLTPTANGYNYVWDSTQNRIFLLDEENKVVSPTDLKASEKAVNLFAFVGKEADLNNFKKDNKDVYSYYLKDGYDASTLTVATGLDVGNNTEITNINYTSKAGQDVIVRTNGGTLTVDASADTVYHYGAANLVDIEAVKNQSFHEYGTASVVTIKEGRFVAEKTAKVINVHVVSKDAKLSEVTGATVVEYTKESSITDSITVENTTKTVTSTDKPTTEIKDEAKKNELVAEGGVAEVNGIQFKDLQSAFNVAKNGNTISVNSDVVIEDTIVVENKEVVLNMNGKTITNTKGIWNESIGSWSLVSIRNTASLTITGNGSFITKEYDCYAIDLQDSSKCTIENGIFVGNIHAAYVQEGELTVKGGTFSVVQKYSDDFKADEFVLNCYDNNNANGTGTAKIIVTGGTFKKFNPADCWAEGEHTNFCADGYTTESSKIPGGTDKDLQYTVVKK